MRSRSVERVNTTVLTEKMLGNARVEGVSGEIGCARKKRELIGWNNQMKKAFFPANRTITIFDLHLSGIDPDLKPNGPAMTSASKSLHLILSHYVSLLILCQGRPTVV
jgi:hypothetical protein